MLYLIHGTDRSRGHRKFVELIESLRKKKPDASVFEVTEETWNEGKFMELISGATLFESKFIVACNHLLKDDRAQKYVVENIKEVSGSLNVFIFLEDEIGPDELNVFEKCAEKIQEFSLKTSGQKKEEFNIFAISDAVGSRDRRGAWVVLQEGLAAGIAHEELFWKAVWQVKQMLLVEGSDGATPQSLGMNPYVFKRASANARNFTRHELRKLSGDLVALYHDARRGRHDFDLAFEKLLLNL